MPIDPTPFEQDVVAVATKLTGELLTPLLAGEVTWTPDCELTVMVTGVVAAPPQLSHSSTTVL
jgi:hypothetical protein